MTSSSKADEYKEKGNDFFQKGQVQEAIDAYSLGLQEKSIDPYLKAVLHSNRATCYLKSPSHLSDCIDDCTAALDPSAQLEDPQLRVKLLFKRAKARFLLSTTTKEDSQLLQEAAKDLLTLLSLDSKNTQAISLLQTIRAKHSIEQKGNTPVAKTLSQIAKNVSAQIDQRQHSFQLLLGLLANDTASAGMELGRLQGVELLWSESTYKTLALQCLACAASHPPFVRQYLLPHIAPEEFTKLSTQDHPYEIRIVSLSLSLRYVLALDHSELDHSSILQTVQGALSVTDQDQDVRLIQAGLELLSEWSTLKEPDEIALPKKTPDQLRSMPPREVAAYKKKEYEQHERLKQWAKDRALLFCTEGTLETLLESSVASFLPHSLQREMCIVLGRIVACIEEQEQVKSLLTPILGCEEGVTIQELDSHEDEEKLDDQARWHLYQKRAQLTTSLLLGLPEVGTWALTRIDGQSELQELIESQELHSMYMASEVVSAAASVETARPLLASLPLDVLLESEDRDIRSGAASAVAKLGLADKALSANEGEVMGLLQVAVELLEQINDTTQLVTTTPKTELWNKAKLPTGPAKATSAVERAIEVLSYLVSKTQVKEELAHGFRSTPESVPALERLVELASMPGAGESLSAYGLATIFSLMAVSTETLRREAFIGKEITMEQYDELQALGKTSLEKDTVPKEVEDTLTAVHERIRKMAGANVPRAMVKLLEGSTDSTADQLVVGLSRMAVEASVRGLMVQQGVLSACLKVEKGENPSELGKKILQHARHCIAKLLVTTNPSLLTASQRMGSIKPLIQLVKDHEAADLQQFEALLALTNLASTDDETKERLVAEKGISTLSYAMYSDHELVRRAGTEAMCNLVPHPAMMKHLANPENLRLWLAFASDYEQNFECARAAAGCLAMSTDDSDIATALVGLTSFKESMTSMLESGNLELMHRVLVVILNLIEQGGQCLQSTISAGLVAFCIAYVDSFHDGGSKLELKFTAEEQGQLSVTIDIAKQIVALAT